MILLLAAALLGPPAPQLAPVVPVEQIADDAADHCALVVAGGAADLMATGWALSRCPTCYEANPLGVNVEARLALKTGGMAGACWLSYKLERRGHRKAAKIFSRTWFFLSMGLAVNNVVHGIRRN